MSSTNITSINAALTVQIPMGQQFLENFGSGVEFTKFITQGLPNMAANMLVIFSHVETNDAYTPDYVAAAALGAAYLRMMKQMTNINMTASKRLVEQIRMVLSSHSDILAHGKRTSKFEMTEQLKSLIERIESAYKNLSFLRQLRTLKPVLRENFGDQSNWEAPKDLLSNGFSKFLVNVHLWIRSEIDKLPVPTPYSKTKVIIRNLCQFLELGDVIEKTASDLAAKYIIRNDNGANFFADDGPFLVASSTLGSVLANCKYNSVVRQSGIAESLFFCAGMFTYEDLWVTGREITKFDSEDFNYVKPIDVNKHLNFLMGTRQERHDTYSNPDEQSSAVDFNQTVYRAAVFAELGDPVQA